MSVVIPKGHPLHPSNLRNGVLDAWLRKQPLHPHNIKKTSVLEEPKSETVDLSGDATIEQLKKIITAQNHEIIRISKQLKDAK